MGGTKCQQWAAQGRSFWSQDQGDVPSAYLLQRRELHAGQVGPVEASASLASPRGAIADMGPTCLPQGPNQGPQGRGRGATHRAHLSPCGGGASGLENVNELPHVAQHTAVTLWSPGWV